MSPSTVRTAGTDSQRTEKPGGQHPTTPATRRWLVKLERWLVRRMLIAIGNPPVRITLPNGDELSTSESPPIAQVKFQDRATLWRVLLDPNLHFGEGYADGKLEIDGDLVALLETIDRARTAANHSGSLVPSWLLRRLHPARTNTRSGARHNIHHHYDLGENFYQLWLDDEMVYSGAYFAEPAMTLGDAQRAKLDYVCRKLRLSPGESVVEIGGGWGALALWMAREYGATVKSINISRPQIAYARRRAKIEGLDSRVEFIEDDYRNLSGQFDALVSLGMLEHVGAAHYREFGRVADRCLTPAGRGLIQTIGLDRPCETSSWIERHIFPGGHLPTLREMADIFEPSGFSILDIENLRRHYAQTLRHWLDRFEASAARVATMFDERFVRIWRLYLSGSCAAFTTGQLQLFQVLFARPTQSQIPWTRAELYV
ncbi:MAG: cyclopropane-fatty-acyl-phospholipid synthase family protein [Planctomycetaceae bacterium]|nr:cyclopropane-fatty-acyl-phospholipid synthase family protein [Planctomycetaceae bacterium]